MLVGVARHAPDRDIRDEAIERITDRVVDPTGDKNMHKARLAFASQRTSIKTAIARLFVSMSVLDETGKHSKERRVYSAQEVIRGPGDTASLLPKAVWT
jgi:hypothetical protein